MAYRTLQDFGAAVPLLDYTVSHQSWFLFNEPLHLISAWKTYERAQHPLIGFLLLGDDKIRKDPTLVNMFGLMSVGGIQEQEEIEMVAQLKMSFLLRKVGDFNRFKMGSILSDKNWSPLLNDAFILAGIHQRRPFHFTDIRLLNDPNKKKKYEFQRSSKPADVRDEWKRRDVNVAQNKLADLSNRPWEVQVWRQFFLDNPDVLWNSEYNCSRILVRELIGLKTFGYQAELSAQQLSFGPKRDANTQTASFRAYMAALRDRQVDYFANNRTKMLTLISEFLFDHPGALVPTRPGV